MNGVPFTRPTIVAAVAFIDGQLTQAAFDHMVLRLTLEDDIASDTRCRPECGWNSVWRVLR